jgi:cell division protein FtsL
MFGSNDMSIKKQLISVTTIAGLLIIVVTSAIAVINSVHNTRQLFAELQQLRHGADDSRVQWGKLLLEQSSYAAYSRIEQLANQKLLMKTPATNEVVMVEQ